MVVGWLCTRVWVVGVIGGGGVGVWGLVWVVIDHSWVSLIGVLCFTALGLVFGGLGVLLLG